MIRDDRPAMKWTEVMDDVYGCPIPAAKVERWERFIRDKIQNLQPGETTRALLWANEKHQYGFPFGKATVDKVVMIIRWFRRGDARIESKGSDAYLEAIYRKACGLSDPLDIWNMLINPEAFGFERQLRYEEVDTLVKRYEQAHPRFERPYDRIRAAGKRLDSKAGKIGGDISDWKVDEEPAGPDRLSRVKAELSGEVAEAMDVEAWEDY